MVHWVMLHTKYQGSRPSGFKQEDFFLCFQYVNVNSVTSMMRPFRPQHHNLNTFGRVSLGDDTYQISILWALSFLVRISLMFSLYNQLIEYNLANYRSLFRRYPSPPVK